MPVEKKEIVINLTDRQRQCMKHLVDNDTRYILYGG